MINYKKIVFIILAVIMFITILMLLIVHAFNNTPISGEKETTRPTTKYVKSGD